MAAPRRSAQAEFITDKMNKADSEQAVQAEEVRQAAVVPLLELRNTVLAKKKQHECTGAWFTETNLQFPFYRGRH